MPKPEPGEEQDHYMSRCIPIVMHEGTAQDSSQAAAICHSMWERHTGKAEIAKYSPDQARDESGRWDGGSGGGDGGDGDSGGSSGGQAIAGAQVADKNFRISDDRVRGDVVLEGTSGNVTARDIEAHVRSDAFPEQIGGEAGLVIAGNIASVRVTNVKNGNGWVSADVDIRLETPRSEMNLGDSLEVNTFGNVGLRKMDTLTKAELETIDDLAAKVKVDQVKLSVLMAAVKHDYHTPKMERCLAHLEEQGFDAGSAHAICYATLGDEANKAGARHSDSDRRIIGSVHDMGGKIQQAMLDLGHTLPERGVETIKAGGLPDAAEVPTIFGVVKAAGDWELDVLANPYGGPHNGRDTDGQYFSPRTKFHEDQIPLPPVVYYHGYGDDKRPMGLPEFIGKTVKRWVDSRGVWYRVVLNRTNKFAQRVWDAARRAAARASSGVVLASHRVDERTGEILSWLNGEVSIFETDSGKQPANSYAVALPALKAVYQQAGLTLPALATPKTDATGAASPVAVARSTYSTPNATEKSKMTDEELRAKAEADLAAEREAQAAADAAKYDEYKRAYKAGAEKAEKDAAEKIKAAEKAAWDAQEDAKRRGRLPLGGTPDAPGQAPYQSSFGQLRKFDGLGVDDLAMLVGLLDAAKKKDPTHRGYSKAALQALATRMAEDKTVIKRKDGRTEIPLGDQARATLKAVGLDPRDILDAQKANELDYSTQANYGDEWVGVEYSRRLWEAVRYATFVLDKMPSVELPDGAESIIVPLESGDPTWYKVAQTTAEDSTNLRPVASVTSSKLGTAQKTLTVAKMGARVQFSQEMVEDSLIPWIAQLRRQLEVSGAEALEGVIIDGDTDATSSTNINAIDTVPTATTLFLLMNGFRKSPLITTTANSRSASGSLVDTDYLATVKLMGAAGKNAQDKSKVDFIVDANTYWKSLELASVKTRDVFGAATLEGGVLTSIWGYPVRQSYRMHYTSAKLMANTAGKIDADTDANNTTGAILAVRYDQWLFGFKRRMQIKLQESIDSDSQQIVAFMRVGIVQRDTEASAITYNVGV